MACLFDRAVGIGDILVTGLEMRQDRLPEERVHHQNQHHKYADFQEKHLPVKAEAFNNGVHNVSLTSPPAPLRNGEGSKRELCYFAPAWIA